jgi:hypothetical protein
MLSGEQLDFIPVLGQACQQLWPVHDNDVYQQFSFLSHIAPASSLAALLLAALPSPHGFSFIL